MTGLPLETQGQLAGAVAILSLVVGAAAWELAKGGLRWVGRSTIAGGVLQLMAFSHHAVSQYEVAIVRANLPLVEVANADSGRERTIERVDLGDTVILEREHVAGWHFASATGHRHQASGAMLQRGKAAEESDHAGSGCRCCDEGCSYCLLGVPGCCCCGSSCTIATSPQRQRGVDF